MTALLPQLDAPFRRPTARPLLLEDLAEALQVTDDVYADLAMPVSRPGTPLTRVLERAGGRVAPGILLSALEVDVLMGHHAGSRIRITGDGLSYVLDDGVQTWTYHAGARELAAFLRPLQLTRANAMGDLSPLARALAGRRVTVFPFAPGGQCVTILMVLRQQGGLPQWATATAVATPDPLAQQTSLELRSGDRHTTLRCSWTMTETEADALAEDTVAFVRTNGQTTPLASVPLPQRSAADTP